MTLDQDIWSFDEYNSNCELEHNRLFAFFGLLTNPMSVADNNKVVVKRSGIWTYEAAELYDGLYQDFGTVSGNIDLVLNDTTSRSGVLVKVNGELQIGGFGANFLSGFVYTFFIVQDAVGGRKVRWPNLSSVVGVIDETPNAITVAMVTKLPNGKILVKNNAYQLTSEVGYYEFRTVDDYADCHNSSAGVSGNVLLNDWGGNLTVSKVNGSALNVGEELVGSNGGLFIINTDGTWTFQTNSEFGDVTVETPVTTSVVYTAHNGQEELSSTLYVTVVAVWDILAEVDMLHWIDVSDPANYTLNGSTVSQVNDLSGNGYHLVQATVTSQPTLIAADCGGMDVISFDGGDSLGYGPIFTEQDRCIFYVVKGNNTIAPCGMTTSGTCLYNNNAGAISSATWDGGVGETIGLNGFAAYQHRSNVITNLLYRVQALSEYNIVVFIWSARKPTGFLNGIPFEIGLKANQTSHFYLTFGSGAYGSFKGRVAERIITDGIPSQALFDKIVGHLAHKYSLDSKLQFNHPYKEIIPGYTFFRAMPDFSYSAVTGTKSGNVLTNDDGAVSVTKVNGSSENVGTAIAGSSGGLFTVNSDGSWLFDPNSDFSALSGTQYQETFVVYTATNGLTEKSSTLTVRVLATYYTELDYDGGGWILLTDEHIVDGVQTYSYDAVTREFSLYASTSNTSAQRFGANVTLKLQRSFTQVRVFHSGGSAYSCDGVVWNNFIYGGNEDVVPYKTHSNYPGWYINGCDLIKNTILVNGWNTRTLLYPGTRISLGLGGYSGCTRATMKNIVLVR